MIDVWNLHSVARFRYINKPMETPKEIMWVDHGRSCHENVVKQRADEFRKMNPGIELVIQRSQIDGQAEETLQKEHIVSQEPIPIYQVIPSAMIPYACSNSIQN
jgi:hypothetical protein